MATRTLFFHIGPLMQAVFYLMALVSMAICLYGVYRRVRLWRQGRLPQAVANWPARLNDLFTQAILHRRIRRRTYAGTLHFALFFGLGALFIGTVIVAIEHYGALVFGSHWLYRGWFYLFCKLALDIGGLLVLLGASLALLRRFGGHRPTSLGNSWKDAGFLTLLMLATLTGFVLEGAGIAGDPGRTICAEFSPIGRLFAAAMHGISPSQYALLWWIHIPLVLSVIAALPYGRWLHLFVIPITILTSPERAMGVLEPISMAEVEETGKIGYGSLAELDRWQLMSLDGCMECGRCTDACPAHMAGKELDPKQIILDLRNLMTSAERNATGAGGLSALSTDIISDASLWACTNCHACVRECPALIRHVDIIDGIRRYRVAEGRLAGTAATMLRQLGSRENPWGLPASQRLEWAQGLEIPRAAPGDGREVLFWVGCSGAFDPRGKQTVKAIAQLFEMAGVKFTILGPEERCSGDPARRTGDEFLFQQLAEANVTTLNGVGAKTIVTQCPHCLHALKNEYPQFGGDYEVLHHTQLLSQLIADKKLDLGKSFEGSVTYHDPCFLARVNGVTQEPRDALRSALTIPLVEVGRKESKTLCCGAGGGRMWMEDSPAERPGLIRARELMSTGAKTVAVGCPFCKIMIGDSIALAGTSNGAAPAVMDIAEVMLAAASAARGQAEAP